MSIASELCSMLVRARCSIRALAGQLAFFPVASYDLVHASSGEPLDVGASPDLDAPLRLLSRHASASRGDGDGLTIVRVVSRQGHTVPVFIITYPGAHYTLLYSHGNSTDCGQMLPTWRDLCVNLRVNVVGYEYTGYGPSAATGVQPSEAALYDAITAVLAYLSSARAASFCGSAERVILYGESLGSAPSMFAASTLVARALVLHAPLASGIRMFLRNRSCCLACCDVFDNVARAPRMRLTGRVFILHGTHDSVIPVTHSHAIRDALHGRYTRPADVWFPDADHNDIAELHRTEYYSRLRRFIASLLPGDAAFEDEPMFVARGNVERAMSQVHAAARAGRPVPTPPGVLAGRDGVLGAAR